MRVNRNEMKVSGYISIAYSHMQFWHLEDNNNKVNISLDPKEERFSPISVVFFCMPPQSTSEKKKDLAMLEH